ncbi:MAG: DNA cytosine methyltransferase [Fimbriimonadaceae bacterium]|nr:DNA cytosine methyltransferase [Fimbriimonadaceae bacterium]
MTDSLDFVSLFSGCGCLDLGLERSGWTCKYQCEWDRHAQAVLRYRFPGVPIAGDIRELCGTDLPRVQLWAFGSPCKEFARCNVRNRDQGLEGQQSRLAKEVVRLIAERPETGRPRVLLWENVGSIFDSPFAKGLDEWFGELAQLGYGDIQAHLLRGVDVGVPQLRDRWFTIMTSSPKGLPDAIWEVESASAFDLLTKYDGEWMPQEQRESLMQRLKNRYAQGKTEKVLGNYEPILNVTGDSPAMFTGNLSWNPQKVVCPTLDCSGATWVYLPGKGVRPLTPVERERLMGLPDDWTERGIYEPWPKHPDLNKRLGGEASVPQTERYRMTGNGVIVPAAELMGRIVKALLVREDLYVPTP